jgi:hypothetical protein
LSTAVQLFAVWMEYLPAESVSGMFLAKTASLKVSIHASLTRRTV